MSTLRKSRFSENGWSQKKVLGGLRLTLKPPYSIPIDKLRLAIWTLPLDFFGQNLTWDLETYPRTYSGHF